MARRREATVAAPTKFSRERSIEIDGFVIEAGDMIKIRGEYGIKFKFHSLVTNTETGAQWIDCFEDHRGQTGCYRSFRIDRVKRIPNKRRRAKRVA